MHYSTFTIYMLTLMAMACSSPKSSRESEDNSERESQTIKLITLDPGHFHAALVQKSMFADVDSVVHVYAPEGNDVKEHLKKIDAYNNRTESPTRWKEEIYTGEDYLSKMLSEKPGNVVVIAGNNKLKTKYINASIDAGLNVFADKPMAINSESFEMLRKAFADAAAKDLLLYDIMTERFEITTILQREFSRLPEVFGTQQKGSSLILTHSSFATSRAFVVIKYFVIMLGTSHSGMLPFWRYSRYCSATCPKWASCPL